MLKPDESWGPAVEKYRLEYEASKESSSSTAPICISYRTDVVSLSDVKKQPEGQNFVL